MYQQLEELGIRLEQTPELGTDYLRDRLLECREKQNTVTDLIIRVNRSYSAVRQRLRAQTTAVRHADSTGQAQRLREELDGMLDEQDSLKLLLDALNVRRGNLARTSSDIRLLDKIIEDKLRPGGGYGGSKPQAPIRPAPTSLPSLDPVEEPVTRPPVIVEPNEIIVPPAIVPAEESHAVAIAPPTPEPVTMLAADDDVDIEKFLES